MTAVTVDPVTTGLRPPAVLVTAASNGDRAGCVVPFHTQCGRDPIRYAVWLPTGSHAHDVARVATHIAVHVLDGGAPAVEALATADGDVPADWFGRCEWRPGPGGVPLVAGWASALVLRLVSVRVEPGGFACLIGELVGTECPAASAAPQADRLSALLDALDVETRRAFVNAAIGAGHALSLPEPGSGA